MTTGVRGYELSREFKLTFACVCLALSLLDIPLDQLLTQLKCVH